jgi:Mrp family chromosome partitioning ATPase
MNVSDKPGLTDVLAGHAQLEDCLHNTAVPGLQVLTSGTQVATPSEVLASLQMQEVYGRLVDGADLVIFDSPGCLGSADASVLANVAGSVLFVAKSGSTKRSNVRRGIDSLRQANAKVLGVAMSGGTKN